MRLVVTSDTHFPIPASLVPDGDALLVVGDLMYSGYPSEWNPRLDALAALPHKHKYLVAGNHDLHLEQYAGPAMAELRAIGVTVVGAPASKDVVELPNGMTLLGLPFVTNLPHSTGQKSGSMSISYTYSNTTELTLLHLIPRPKEFLVGALLVAIMELLVTDGS